MTLGNGKCGYCGERYGSHSVSCSVKYRDVNGTPPDVQEAHELLDVYYQQQDGGGPTEVPNDI